MKQLIGMASMLLMVLLAILFLTATLAIVVAHHRHVLLLSVQSDSMIPSFKKGDAVIVRQNRQPRVGDIIAYRSQTHSGQVVSHRLTAIDRAHNQYLTKGDNLRYPDPTFSSQDVIGVVVQAVPRVGRVLDIVRQPLGLVVLVYAPATGLIIWEVTRLRQYFKQFGRQPCRHL